MSEKGMTSRNDDMSDMTIYIMGIGFVCGNKNNISVKLIPKITESSPVPWDWKCNFDPQYIYIYSIPVSWVLPGY